MQGRYTAALLSGHCAPNVSLIGIQGCTLLCLARLEQLYVDRPAFVLQKQVRHLQVVRKSIPEDYSWLVSICC